MKTLYFVRHGESTGNVGDFRQGPDTPLSIEGEQQAKFVAERFRTIPIDKVIVSTYQRAKQTAEAINKVIQKDIIYTDLLVERIKPTSIIGLLKNDPEAIRIDDLTLENFHNENFKFEDGETFFEMKKRSLDLLKLIESCTEEKILLVSHGIFLRMVLACVILGEELTSYEYWKFYLNLDLGNTSITVFEQKEFKGVLSWKLKTWGDIAHLGDVSVTIGN